MSEPSSCCGLEQGISGEASWTELIGVRKRSHMLGLDKPLGNWPRYLKSRPDILLAGGRCAALSRVSRVMCLCLARMTPGPEEPGQSSSALLLGQTAGGSQSARHCDLSALRWWWGWSTKHAVLSIFWGSLCSHVGARGR